VKVRLAVHAARTIGTYKNLVEEVLDELLLQWSRGEEAMEIGAEQFGYWL